MRRITILLTALALVVPAAVTAAEPAAELDASDIERVFHETYGNVTGDGTSPFFDSGTDLAFDGDYVYAAEQADTAASEGGVHIFDVSDPDNPVKVGFVDCPGSQNDVAVVEPGIIALGYHNESGNGCRTNFGGPRAGNTGIRLFDVSDPANPVGLGHAELFGTTPDGAAAPAMSKGTHTLTVHPSGNFIYSSPGGLPTNGMSTQHIIDVTNREGPYEIHTFQPNATGCHDFEFFTSTDGRDMGVCVGLTQSQIWDVSEPASPQIVSLIHNPLIDFMHTGMVTHDGKYLVVSDEAIVANDCVGGPTGAMFSFDISIPEAPVPMGYFGIDRAHEGQALNASTASGLHGELSDYGRSHWCTAHLYNFIPGTYLMVAVWYSGGLNIIDWTDMANPREIAHYRTDGDYQAGEVTNYWSGYWHEGRIYANDRRRGFDALRWTAYEDQFGSETPEPEEISAFAQSLPSTPTSLWRSGRFFDTPTAEQALWLASQPAPQLSPYACRLVATG